MKTSLSQQQLSRKATFTGLGISIIFHIVLVLFFIHIHVKVTPATDKQVKISLNTFVPPSAPLVAPVPVPSAPPTPQPEPVVVPPKPIEKPKPIDKPKPIEKPKPIKKPTPVPTPKPIEKPKPVVDESTQKVDETPMTTSNTSATSTSVKPSAPPAPSVGEFNFSSSVGDEKFAQIQRAIQKHHKYPKKALKMRRQGIVEVKFYLQMNGDITDIKVVKSSGTEVLDEAAIETIRNASKDFPTLEKNYIITIPVVYNIK